MSSTQNTENDIFKVGNIIRVVSKCDNGFSILRINRLCERTKDYELGYDYIFLCDIVIYDSDNDNDPEVIYGHKFHWLKERYKGELLHRDSLLPDCDLGV